MLSVPCEKVVRPPKGSQPTGWEPLDMAFSLTSRKSRRLRSLWGVKGNPPAAQKAPGEHFTQGNNREGHFLMNILNEKFKSEIPGTGTQTSPLSTFRCIQRELQPGPRFSLAFLMLSNYNFPQQKKVLNLPYPKIHLKQQTSDIGGPWRNLITSRNPCTYRPCFSFLF